MRDELALRQDQGRRFLDALRREFVEEARREDAFASRLAWVAGGLTSAGHPVVIYRQDPSPTLLGRLWDLDHLSTQFVPSTPETLAHDMWHSEVNEPHDHPQRLDVDWADGLVDNPEAVRWLGHARDQRMD